MILAYHSVHPSRKDALSVSPEAFEWQLDHLARRGLRTVSLYEYLNAYTEQGETPSNWVAITFDDGYQDNFVYAFPLLTRFQYPATFFVPSGHMGSQDVVEPSIVKRFEANEDHYRPLRLDQMRDLANAGMTIGSHTVNHRILPGLPLDIARAEIEGSKTQLESMLDVPVDLFCYPSGRFEPSTVELVSAAKYIGAVVTPSGPGVRETRFTMKRVGIYRRDSNRMFQFKLSPMFGRMREIKGLWAAAKFGRNATRAIFK